MEIKSYKDLEVWKKGLEIADTIYVSTGKFPSEEKHVLVSQMRRSAVSIPSNIAEGHMRQHTKEFRQFCYISLGSCAELETQVIIAGKRGYITKLKYNEVLDRIDHEKRMLLNLIKKIH